MFVKVCGITSNEHIDWAVHLGYSAIGVVLIPGAPGTEKRSRRGSWRIMRGAGYQPSPSASALTRWRTATMTSIMCRSMSIAALTV